MRRICSYYFDLKEVMGSPPNIGPSFPNSSEEPINTRELFFPTPPAAVEDANEIDAKVQPINTSGLCSAGNFSAWSRASQFPTLQEESILKALIWGDDSGKLHITLSAKAGTLSIAIIFIFSKHHLISFIKILTVATPSL